MPVRSQLRRAILVDHTIDFGGGVQVAFRFNRNQITDAWFREWGRFQEAENVEAINKALADLIESWDLVNDDGSEFPPSAENISDTFSVPEKTMIVRELMGAAVPTRAEGNASPVLSPIPPSDSTPPPLTPPNGEVPSLSPLPSASPSTT